MAQKGKGMAVARHWSTTLGAPGFWTDAYLTRDLAIMWLVSKLIILSTNFSNLFDYCADKYNQGEFRNKEKSVGESSTAPKTISITSRY